MTKDEFEKYGLTSKFQKLFVFKEFHEGVLVHYLPSALVKPGPMNGSRPSVITRAEKSFLLHSYVKTKVIEDKLMTIYFRDPEGDTNINSENFSKLGKALRPYLVSRKVAKAIAGSYLVCSASCLNE